MEAGESLGSWKVSLICSLLSFFIALSDHDIKLSRALSATKVLSCKQIYRTQALKFYGRLCWWGGGGLFRVHRVGLEELGDFQTWGMTEGTCSGEQQDAKATGVRYRGIESSMRWETGTSLGKKENSIQDYGKVTGDWLS